MSTEAVAALLGMSKRNRVAVLDIADRIAETPSQISDYRTADADGRSMENLMVDGFLFTYWVDHASREVRITEVIRL